MRSLALALILFLVFSCEKKELPVARYNRGDVTVTQIDMGSNYKNQVWFSLQDNKIISTNLKTDWDLAFETSAAGFHIVLNGAKAMRAYKTGFSSLAQVIDTAGLGINGKADVPSGNLDSTAMGDWQQNNSVYIINRGYDELGVPQGFYKIKITGVTASRFTFEYASVSSAEVLSATVNKDEAYNFIAFSFGAKSQLNIEPKKTAYDLCFTQYTHIFPNPFQYYQVTGILSNAFNTRMVMVTDKAFADIGITDTLNRTFSMNRNVMGYDWKTFDLNTNLYTVDPKQCFLIQDNKGFYYKLHFTDFYNTQGIKGFPKFEFKKL